MPSRVRVEPAAMEIEEVAETLTVVEATENEVAEIVRIAAPLVGIFMYVDPAVPPDELLRYRQWPLQNRDEEHRCSQFSMSHC